MNRISVRMEGAGRSLRQLLDSRAPWSTVLVILLVQVLVALNGGYEGIPQWFERFGLYRDGVLAGRLWQPFTYGLLHGSWLHVVVNALCLLMLGAKLEHALGGNLVLKTMLAGLLGGAVGHLAFSFGGNAGNLLVGSSGAAFGLLILTTTLSPESRMFPVPISGRHLGFGLLLFCAILALMDPMLGLPGFSLGGRWMVKEGLGSWWSISHSCHLGGGLGGWLYGRWLLRPRITLEKLRADRARREAARGSEASE